MKFKTSLLLTALLTLPALWGAAAASPRFAPKPVSPRSIRLDNKQTLCLAKGGKAQCEVVVPRRSCYVVNFAGAELAGYLSRIIGSKVAVVPKPSGNKTAFLLGADAAKKIGFDLKTIDRDGFLIRTGGREIVIAGNDDPRLNPARAAGFSERGTLNGVYEFLERFGGVRFYFPGEIGTVVPRKADWSVPGINILDRPDMQDRRTYVARLPELGNGKLNSYAGMDIKDVMRLSSLQLRGSTLNMPNCHGLAFLGLVQRFAKTKPEFFALRDNGKRHDGSVVTRGSDKEGQLCFTNDELKEVIFQDAKAFLSGKPASSRGIIMPDGKSYWSHSRFSLPFFNIMPNDSNYSCRCPKCRPHYKAGNQASSNMIWKFKTDIARKLQQEKVPGYVTMMAYSNYRNIPDVDIPSNVVVQLAISGPWQELSPKQADDIKLLAAWRKKLNAKTYLWTYTNKCGTRGVPDVPNFTPKAVGTFYKKAAPYIFGGFLESETDFWISNFMNFYVFSKFTWDNSTDLDALMKEHLTLMYGAAAPQMKEFYETLERHWLKDIMSDFYETTAGPEAVIPSKYEIWTKIYGTAEVARVNRLFDSAEKAAAKDSAALKRVKFMRKELWGQVLNGVKNFQKGLSDNKVWEIYAQPAAEKITIDGKLDEKVWKQASPVWMIPRNERHAAEVHTRVRMAADKDNLYFGIECDEPHTDKMVCGKRKKDENDMWRDNLVELFFSKDSQSDFIYQFMLTSSGMILDSRNSHNQLHVEYESHLEYKPGVIPGKMWIAEVRIPRKSLPELQGDSFAVNFTRGRVLEPSVKVKTPYYAWARFGFQTPENCGKAIIGVKPQSQSLIRGGDFDLQVIGKRFLGKPGQKWCWAGCHQLDREIFRTCGQSARIEPGKHNTLRQWFDKGVLKPNTKYQLSFFVRLENVKGDRKNPGAGFSIDLRYLNSGKNTVYCPFKQSLKGTIPWSRYAFTFTTPAEIATKGTPYIGFNLGRNATGKVWVDHIELIEVKE